MKIYIASDHAGFELKEKLVKYLEESGIDVVDKGPKTFNPEDDYPDFISLVAAEVSKEPKFGRGIVIGLSGQGEAIVANKFRDVRAGVFYGNPVPPIPGVDIPKLLRLHNDANVLSLGAKFITFEQATEAVDTWIGTQFSNEPRHARRIKEIHEIDLKKSR